MEDNLVYPLSQNDLPGKSKKVHQVTTVEVGMHGADMRQEEGMYLCNYVRLTDTNEKL